MSTNTNKCPECGNASLFTTSVSSAGGYGPVLLPGLHGLLRYPKFNVVVCADCGLTRFYAEESARKKLERARQWTRLKDEQFAKEAV
jgi:predicted nucleic-acid-binding Zn-ribbon protein